MSWQPKTDEIDRLICEARNQWVGSESTKVGKEFKTVLIPYNWRASWPLLFTELLHEDRLMVTHFSDNTYAVWAENKPEIGSQVIRYETVGDAVRAAWCMWKGVAVDELRKQQA